MFGFSNSHTVECVEQTVIHAQMKNIQMAWFVPLKGSYRPAFYLHDSVGCHAQLSDCGKTVWTVASHQLNRIQITTGSYRVNRGH